MVRGKGAHWGQGSAAALLLALFAGARADAPRVVHAYRGTTPVLDGVLRPGEWADALRFVSGIGGWNAQFAAVLPVVPADLDIEAWVKHDNASLFFAFRIRDDLLYGRQTERWLPAGNPSANNLTRAGWPWFGDEMELLFSALPPSAAPVNATPAGNGTSWQMVINSDKSRLGGAGVGGLLEGEPRSSPAAWALYQSWILRGAMRGAVGQTTGDAPGGGSTTIFEWAVAFDPCLELSPGVFYSPAMPAVAVGFNIALGDADTPALGDPVFGLRHEMWLSGTTCAWTNCHCLLREFATLVLEPGPLARAVGE